MQVEFVTSLSKRPLGTKCFTFSKTIYEFCLICSSSKFCLLRNAWLLVDIFSLNEHMGLLILVCITGEDSFKEQYLFDLYTLFMFHYYSGYPLSPPQHNF